MQQTRPYTIWSRRGAQIWTPRRVISGALVGIAATASFSVGWDAGDHSSDRAITHSPETVSGDVSGSELREQRQCAWGHDLPSGCTAWIVWDPATDSWSAEVWMGDTPEQAGGGPFWVTHALDPGEVDGLICPPDWSASCAPRTIGPELDHSPEQAYPSPRGP